MGIHSSVTYYAPRMQVNFGNLVLLFGAVLTLFESGLCRQKIGQKCSRDYHCESRHCAQSYCVSDQSNKGTKVSIRTEGSDQRLRENEAENSGRRSTNYGGYSSLLDLLVNGSVREVDTALYNRRSKSRRKGNGQCSVRFDAKLGRYVSSNCSSHVGRK